MSERTHVLGPKLVVTTLPAGWQASPERDANADLVVVGRPVGLGPIPRVTVRTESIAPEPVERVSVRVMNEVQAAAPDAVVIACDVWPHPVWGVGRYIQSARVEDGQTLAHDRYVFVGGDRCITVSVDCLLSDLLSIEEDVAVIVASVRPNVEGE